MRQDFKTKKHLELLAPAGSFEAFKAVIHAGADAVYLGGTQYGARAYAGNFTKEELLEAIDYAHLHGRRVYLTVNTLLKQPEMESLYSYLLPYYEQGLDAVIIQDFGVMQYIRRCFPGLPVHVSTQMSVADAYGAAYLKSLGASRIVAARELSLEEIQALRSQCGMRQDGIGQDKIEQDEIEIECFVHGALCYCYSGQCLLSSMLGGRSGNRGRCAQPCRLPYTVLDQDGRMLSQPECYPLSPKDLCAVSRIPELAQAGVSSFKIEGRMKSAEYAAGVTAVYRKYIDRYESTGRIQVQEEDKKNLFDAGNRSGFTSGYYTQHNGPDMITLTRPEHTKTRAEYLQAVSEAYVNREQKIPVHAEAFFRLGEPAMLTVSTGNVTGFAQYGRAEAAQKQPLSREAVTKQLSRMGNTPYAAASVSINMDDSPLFLPKQALNHLRRDALDDLTALTLLPYRRNVRDPAQNPIRFSVPDPNIHMHNPAGQRFPAFTVLIEEEAQLSAVVDYDFITRIYLDSSMYACPAHDSMYAYRQLPAKLAEHARFIQSTGRQAYFMLPAVFRRKTVQFYDAHWQSIEQTGIDGYLVKSMDELGFLDAHQIDKDRCVLDHSLYAYSNAAKYFYQEAGWNYDTVPLELNKKELSIRDNTTSELVIYGRMPLMISAQCLYQTLGQCRRKEKHKLLYLKDRYNRQFPVKNNCVECYNTIYNARTLSLLQLSEELPGLQAAAYRLHFTIESADEVRRILDCCRQAFSAHEIPDMEAVLGAYTNGHYKRGVE